MRPDFLRRSTPTPFAADLRIMGRTVRLESDSAAVLDQTRTALANYSGVPSTAGSFLWRLVAEPDSGWEAGWPDMPSLSDEGLSFVNIGQRTFIAVDLEAHEAVSFVEERFTNDELGFDRLFLATLVALTAPALGLTPVPAACVVQDGRGLLIFAPPRQGKTILGYFACRQGLELHADDIAFLEPDLRVWGGPWPIAFHEDASDLWPELLEITQLLTSARDSCLCWNQGARQGSAAEPVQPVSCLFLERKEAARLELARLTPGEIERQFERSGVVREGRCWRAQSQVLEGLHALPAYRLTYGSAPAEAASLLLEVIGLEPLATGA